MIPHGISGSKCIDLNKMVDSMTKEIDCFWSLYDPGGDGTKICPIYRVPEHIFEIDRIAYEPIVISFDPYHYGAHQLQAMEKQKWEHLDAVLKLNCRRNLHDYIKTIAQVEKQARKCYSEEIKMERKKFLQMLLLDACFLLMSIDVNVGTRVSNSRFGNMTGEAVPNLKQSADGVEDKRSRENKDAMELDHSQERAITIEMENVNHTSNTENVDAFGGWLTCSAWHDVLLLENQIPFFVVESVHELVAGQDTVGMLRSETAKFVEDIIGHYPKAIQEMDRPKDFYHLLHLCHMYFRPSQKIEA